MAHQGHDRILAKTCIPCASLKSRLRPAAAAVRAVGPRVSSLLFVGERIRGTVDSALGAAVLRRAAPPLFERPVWHAHEMLFGFVLAVIVGFLFTAGRNWSGWPTPTGPALAALAALWVAGRVLVLTPWTWAAAVANVTFPLAAAIALAIPFLKARNRRNYFFAGLLVLMAVAAAVVQLAQLGVINVPSGRACNSASMSCCSLPRSWPGA